MVGSSCCQRDRKRRMESGLDKMPKVLILGASTGIGRALANEFARHGYNLVLTGRDEAEVRAIADDLTIRHAVRCDSLVFDVLDFAAHQGVLGSALAHRADGLGGTISGTAVGACAERREGTPPLELSRREDGFEGVVLCIGYLGDKQQAETDLGEARRLLDSNFTGCVLALEVLARHFMRQRAGFICAISSVAGDRGRQSNYLYCGAKAGLTAYLEGLRNRLFHHQVRVITVKPGFVDTPMTYGRPGLFLVARPERVAKSIFRAIQRGKDVVYVPWFWRPIMLLVRIIPEQVFKRLRL